MGGLAFGLCAAAGAALANDGTWGLGLRGVYADDRNQSDAVPLLAIPSDGLQVNDRWAAQFDAQYFLTPHWSGELDLTYPQSQDLRYSESGSASTVAGGFKEMPLVLTAKYHFLPGALLQPYLGAGVNWTHFSSVNLAIPNGPLELRSWSVGPAIQAGLDWRLAPHLFANADLKWSSVQTDVDLCCVKVSEIHLDPLMFGVGVSYRFGGGQ